MVVRTANPNYPSMCQLTEEGKGAGDIRDQGVGKRIPCLRVDTILPT